MKHSYKVYKNGEYEQVEVNYIPVRYIIAILITIVEILAIMGTVLVCALYIPYFYIALILTVVVVVISIIASNDNPDYKVPWLLFVITLPIVGVMLYFIFSKRKVSNKMYNRLLKCENSLNIKDDDVLLKLKEENELIASQAICLKNIANTHIYQNTKITYFNIGENMCKSILEQLNKAQKFIFLEFFIIEEGKFWNDILNILIEKSKCGVEVKLIYDDIGCMMTLPGNYYKKMKKHNIDCVPFSKLKGQADGEFNNRSHRKILVIDGKVGFTGGVNIADEYINEKEVYGHWKDTGILLEGEAVNELTKLFLTDYYINVRKETEIDFNKYYTNYKINDSNYCIPFGDGPNPIYEKNVGKSVIMNLLNHAKKYVYITTPYLILDNELIKCIENTSIRGVDVRIIVPHIPDKKLVFEMTKSNYQLLMKSNVKIYEYTPGFIHAKSYICDDEVGMIGTINLDYRSLTHHFENGVWMYNKDVVKNMKEDFLNTQELSQCMNEFEYRNTIIRRMIRSIVRIFSPLL